MARLSDINYGRQIDVLDIVRGKFPGARIIRMFADGSIGTGATRSAWADSVTGNQPTPTSVVAMEIVSSSTSDTAAGTGARTVEIEGVNGSFQAISEIVTLNGTTPVPLTGAFMRINRARVLTTGSGALNAGAISIRTVSGSVKRAQIEASRGQTGQLQYTVPAGKTAFVRRVAFSSLGDSSATPLVGTHFLSFVGRSPVATPAELVYVQEGRFSAFRGATVERVYGWEFQLEEGQVFDPSIRNDTASTLVWSADSVILEFDA